MTTRIHCFALALVAVVIAAGPTYAGDPITMGGYDLGASLTAGYRFVDVGGSNAKYREDYNLQPGPRLFNLDLGGTATDPATAPVDRFHLVVDTPGNEPVSSYQLTAADRQHWDFGARLTRSKYFYAVPELFENPVPGNRRIDDLHDFDQIRTNGAVDFTIRQGNLPKMFVGYRLYRQDGDTSSTVYVPGGDTFLVRSPVDARTNVGLVGTELDVAGANIRLEQQYRRLDRDVGLHGPLPGLAGGLDPTDTSTLQSENAVSTEHVDEPITIIRAARSFGDRVDVAGSYFYSHADMSADWLLRRSATTDTPGLSGGTNQTTRSHATLDTNVADIGATVRITETFRAHATYRFDEQWQRGGLSSQDPSGFQVIGSGHDVRLNRVTGDFEWAPRRNLTMRAGLRYAWRDANLSSSPGAQQTQTLGAIADVRYRPWSMLDLFARYESAQVDDPYVSVGEPTGRPPIPGREIELTFVNRGSAGFTLRPRDWVRLGYRFIADSRENDTFGARSAALGNSVTLTLTPIDGLSALVAYSRRDIDNSADILIAPAYAQTGSAQAGSEDVLTSQVTYDFGLWGQRWSAGGHVYYVRGDQHWRPRFENGLQGDTLYDLDRVDGGATLTWHHPWIEPSIDVRRIDYTERVLSGNDYSATIVAITLTRRFGATDAN